MSSHFSQGRHTKQAHKAIPEGLYEEEQGHKGFFGPVSHLLKKIPSTTWVEIDGPLRPHMFDLCQIMNHGGTSRLLSNQNVVLSLRVVPLSQPQGLVAERNADGDLLLFCHSGQGEILSEYGLLTYKKGHYVVIPKCLTFSIAATTPSVFLVIENRTSHYQQPDRGLLGRHALYDQEAINKPDLYRQKERLSHWGPVMQVQIQRQDVPTRFRYETCVFSSVEGWKGDLYPYSLHVDDIMPLMSHRAHLPPSAHTTFVAQNFVVCTFLPRPLEHDADALKVPFYHQNIDYDEVLFYHEGDFFSRDNLHAGMMSLHPAGFPHGPHPKAVKSIGNKTHTNEYAVMIDTRFPLKVESAALQVELTEYWRSWRT